ncbi:hypothetical protein ASD75_10595 [Acidovorax sp. Root568]|nr:hypothetical protein ASD75_10595 [Acidovorax sp. Root568]
MEALDAKGRQFYSRLDLMQIAQGRNDEIARLAVQAGMHDYLSTKRLRELGAAFLQHIGSAIHLVDRDGFGQVKDQGIEYRFYVHRGVIHTLGTKPSIKVACVPSSEQKLMPPSCELQTWNDHIGKHLKGNPIMLIAVLAALASAMHRAFNLPRLILMIVGQSSQGKTTVQQIAQSAREQAREIENCAGTANGIRARLEQYQDCPAFLDELHLAENLDGLVKLIFLVGNSASRKTSAADQKAHEAPPLTCGLIAASEKTLAEIVATSRTTLTEGISARLLEVVVSGKNGIFHKIPEGLTPKQFSDQLKTACEAYYGPLWDAWVSGLSRNHEKISVRLPAKLQEVEAELCSEFEITDRVTTRMVRGLAVWVCAGHAALKMKLLQVTRSEIIDAAKLVLKEHVTRQKHGTTPVGEKVIMSVRNLIDRNANRFHSLSMFGRTEQSGIYGYTKGDGEDRLFLFLPGVFEELVGAQFGTQMACQKLLDAGYLFADSEGFQRQFRLPQSGQAKGMRKRFYAVKASICYESLAEPT